MWDCLVCKCKAIAASIAACPMCRKERDMPKTTTGGGSNAAALPGETGYIEPVAPEPVAAAGPEPVVLKADLQDQARDLGLPVSGTKAQLADAIATAPDPVPAVAPGPSLSTPAPKPAPVSSGPAKSA